MTDLQDFALRAEVAELSQAVESLRADLMYAVGQMVHLGARIGRLDAFNVGAHESTVVTVAKDDMVFIPPDLEESMSRAYVNGTKVNGRYVHRLETRPKANGEGHEMWVEFFEQKYHNGMPFG